LCHQVDFVDFNATFVLDFIHSIRPPSFISRIIDTLMLFAMVKWSAVYVTPKGAVFLSNIVSEVFVGAAFTITALIGSFMLLFFPRDKETGV